MDFKKVILPLFVIWLILSNNHVLAQLNSDIVVIGNDIGNTTLTQKQIIAYAKGEKTFWQNAKKVIIALPSAKSELVNVVASAIYKTNSGGVQKYWLSLVFQGRADPPIFFGTDEETIRFVEKNKGAIGFISIKNKLKAGDLIIDIKTE